MNSKPLISIIIVHYKADKELFDCISSLISHKTKNSFEIIVVDNDEEKKIEKKLKAKFPKINYIINPVNSGYGGGNNLGALHAQGEILFILNPDTLIKSQTLDVLYDFIQSKPNVGAVSPLLLDESLTPFDLQGSGTLNPLNALVVLSFVNKYFPKNPVSHTYFLTQWDKTTIKRVDVVPGTAFMIKRSTFYEVGGFDEFFFLYFEEYDLCLRLSKMGLQSYILPEAEIVHLWKRSTQHRNDTHKIYKKSRHIYFKKHFGRVPAYFVRFILFINKNIIKI